MSIEDQLKRGLIALGLDHDADVQRRLVAYLALIEKWNRTYNLTAIREPEKMVSHHLLDCLAVAPHLQGEHMLDVGSGAGLPGIPLALTHAAMQVTLLDSNRKKAAFLNQAVIELGLTNAEVCDQRVESLVSSMRYDLIISRAFSDMREFVQATRHLLASGGRIAAMKGLYPYEEIEKLPAGCKVLQILPLAVPGLEGARHLVLLGLDEES